MTKKVPPPHLKLVSTAELEPKKAIRARRTNEKQLAFPYPESSTVFLVYVEALSHKDFAGIFADYAPRWVFDVRTVPRLDVIATSRVSAFGLFEKTKTTYIDLFGRLDIKSYLTAEANPAFWSASVFGILKNSERTGAVYISL